MSTNETTWRQPADGHVSPPRVTAVGYFSITLVCLVIGAIGPALPISMLLFEVKV